MPSFSKHSNNILKTCDPRIVQVFDRVIMTIDCRAISGRRDKSEQDELFEDGKSQVKYPASYHNAAPLSKAIDIVPFPIDWNDRERFTLFAGYVLGIADSMGYNLTWGGNWAKNWKPKGNRFDDFGHFQIED